ncbi:MAG TPA: FAD-binding protein [Gemmatimonadaceae bacterium]|nr:FAD-binding protein [Gemmatimonadaceae bacterium]
MMAADLRPAAGELLPRSTCDVRERVREAAAQAMPLRIAGAGEWLDAGRPVRAHAMLSTRALAGVVKYVPGDLTLTVHAGTTLGEIAHATAAHGQWLTLDPYGGDGTLGAAVATASYGPLAHAFGTPRDLVLGLELVSGEGSIVRAGGRVVKNVAGFDLTRLLTGSWGTLGVITEITVRLRALPEVQTSLAIPAGERAGDIDALRRALSAAGILPLAAQAVDAACAARLELPRRTTLLLRLGGNAAHVRAERDRVRALGRAAEVPTATWELLRTLEPPPWRAAVLRLSQLASDFADTWRAAGTLVERWADAYRHGDPGRGMVRCVLPLGDAVDEGALASIIAAPFAGSCIVERMPPSLWSARPGAADDRLSRGIRNAYDPGQLLNPGILGAT